MPLDSAAWEAALDPASIGQWLTDGKVALDLIRSAGALLPTGKRLAVEQKASEAEAALKLAEASAAQALGYKLCRCAFPPEITLWDKEDRAHVCGRCGDRKYEGLRISPEALEQARARPRRSY